MAHLQSAFGALSESNQQQQQQNPNFCQPMQTKPSGMFNQPSNLYSNQPQQSLQQPYNVYQPPNQMPCNNNLFGHNLQPPSSYPSSSTGCYLPPNLLDQLRALTHNSTPIFILPSVPTSSNNSTTSPSCVTSCFSPTCIPYPMPSPIYQNFASRSTSNESTCKCTHNISKSQTQESSDGSWQMEVGGVNWNSEHVCKENQADGTVCSKKNCPASIQLQAMISQLLAIQGVVPSAITRILLKRVPGSNIHDSQDEIIEKALRCIRQLPKDGLLRESCNSREVTKLLGLYLTSSSTIPRIIPVLTTAQLKCNVLKALVENLVSARLMEEKNCSGVDSDEPLDRLLLELKPEDELRQILSSLRERECDERVNMSFAPCASQRRFAEARLASVQKKIQQVEDEMQRRRDAYGQQQQCKDSDGNETSRHLSLLCAGLQLASHNKHFDSPDPFADLCVTSPKRLLLKPHVGSPETTYDKPTETTCKSVSYDKQTDDCVCAGTSDDNAENVESSGEAENKDNANN